METKTKIEYQVWDLKEKAAVPHATYKSRKMAQKAADKWNLQYGAHRYAVKNLTTGICF